MSRTGNPDDNAQAESFSKTLQYDASHLFEDQNLAEARGRHGPVDRRGLERKATPRCLGIPTASGV